VSVRVTVDGVPRLRAALHNLTDEAGRRARREVKRAALNVEGGAKQRCPVDTGRLRSSITHQVDADGLGAVVGTNVEYAAKVEFGTLGGPIGDMAGLSGWMTRKGIGAAHGANIVRKLESRGQRAQPYLFPALEAERPAFIQRMRTALGSDFVRGS
jgi:HK97 gp10 family phage protein